VTPDEPRLLRSSATVAVGSLLSRLTGLVRLYATGRAIGTVSWLAGAYNASNNVPNIVYELAVGGVLSASLVPLFVDRLEARRRFAAAAFAPAVNNLVATAALLALPAVVTGDLRGANPLTVALAEPRVLLWLGLGTTLGVVASAAVVVPVLLDRQLHLRFRPNLRHPLVGRLLRLSGWTVGYVAANQATSVVTILVANRAPKGAIAAYDYAYIFFIVPHGLLAVSFMTALTPELARYAQRRDLRGLRREWTNGLRLTGLLMLPAAVGLFVLAQPVVGLLFSGRQDVLLTAGTLRAFAVGLAGFSLYLFALRPFYAEGNLRVPFRLNVIENAVQIGLTVVLGLAAGAAGLALAHSIAYLVAAVLAFAATARHLGRVPLSSVAPLRGMAIAALAMGVVTAASLTLVRWLAHGLGFGLPPLAEVVVGVAVGVPAYVAYLRGFGAAGDLEPILRRVRGLLRR
jgi:putative peptidoglycan lipid II flippase